MVYNSQFIISPPILSGGEKPNGFQKGREKITSFLFALWQTAARPNKLFTPHTPKPVRAVHFGGASKIAAPCGAPETVAPYTVQKTSFNRLLCEH